MDRHPAEHGHADPAGPHGDAQCTDPVCGMRVDPATSRHHAQFQGTTFHFCSAGCRARFTADPPAYLRPRPAAPTPAEAAALYTCPMHTQIRQRGPGACPICGMALELATPTSQAGPIAAGVCDVAAVGVAAMCAGDAGSAVGGRVVLPERRDRSRPCAEPGDDTQHPQNLLFAFADNTIGVPVAAGALYPAFGIVLSPVMAAAMWLSSVSVIANAPRLRTARCRSARRFRQ